LELLELVLYLYNNKVNQNNLKMQISQKLMNKWVALKSKEDTAKVAELAKVSSQAVRNAFREKKCSTPLFIALANYYKKKGEMLKEFI